MSGLPEFVERALGRAHRDAQHRHGPDHEVHADVAQLVDREQLALAELRHVREQGHVDGGAHRRELVEGAHRLGEDRVGTGIDERLRAVGRGVEPLGGADVGARHDEEVRVAARVDRGADALDRGVLVDDLLAVEVPAALRVDLVLDVGAGEPGVLELLDAAGHVHRLAEAGVGVDDRRQLGHAGDLLAPARDLAQGREADIGQPKVGREHGARHVDAVEALALDESRRERVEGAGELQQFARGEPLAKRRALLGGRGGCVEHGRPPRRCRRRAG
jgi:hypothetical protein